MVDRTEPTFDAVERALRDAALPAEASEIHGELGARLCLLGQEAGRPWVVGVMGEAAAPETEIILEALAARTSVALEAGDMSFNLLLPPDDASLELRVEAMSLWAQGFLHGLGVGGAAAEDHWIYKNDPTREIIEDFSQIARAAFAEDETEAEGEAALVELEEFVRVSVQLVFEELRIARNVTASSGTH